MDIGGRHLDVSRMGAGAPTIVFEVGLADSLNTWLPVATAAAELTSVVLYSRAGFGRSDPSPPSPDGYGARHAASDLHELLRRLALRPPFVLVGRSYGGLLVRLYTSLYPSDVAGLVLVDGTHERQVKEFGRIDSTYPGAFRASFDSVLKTLPPGAEAEEIRETVRIQAAGAVEGMAPLPDIPLARQGDTKAGELSLPCHQLSLHPPPLALTQFCCTRKSFVPIFMFAVEPFAVV